MSARSALAAVRADQEVLISDWLRFAGHAAPKGKEQQRADVVAEAMRGIGDLDIWIDDAPNVYARKRGTGTGPRVAIVATLDDLEPIARLRDQPGAPLRYEAGRVIGPCVATASSDAMVLAILRALPRLNIEPVGDLLVVCVSGEETGLTGMKRLIAERSHEIDLVIEVLGGVGTVSFGAIGSHWLEVVFADVPRHSLGGGRSMICEAVAKLTLAIHELTPEPDDHDNWSILRVNGMHAGAVFNHSPEQARLVVDMRSTDATWLAQTLSTVEGLTQQVAEAHGVSGEVHLTRSDAPQSLPNGAANPLVTSAVTAIEAVGHSAIVRPWSSSNLNVAMAARIPGIAMEGTERGGRRGELDEWCDVDGVVAGVAASLLVLADAVTTKT